MEASKLDALLAALAERAPALRTAGVRLVKVDGVEFALDAPAAAVAPERPMTMAARKSHAETVQALREAGRLSDDQANEVIGSLQRFE